MPYERADCISKPVQITTNLSREMWNLAKDKNIKWCIALAHGIRILTNPDLNPTALKKKIEKLSTLIQQLCNKINDLRKQNRKLTRSSKKTNGKKKKKKKKKK